MEYESQLINSFDLFEKNINFCITIYTCVSVVAHIPACVRYYTNLSQRVVSTPEYFLYSNVQSTHETVARPNHFTAFLKA